MAQKQNPTEELTMNIRYIYVYMLVKIERCYPKQIKMGLLPSCVYIYIYVYSLVKTRKKKIMIILLFL